MEFRVQERDGAARDSANVFHDSQYMIYRYRCIDRADLLGAGTALALTVRE